MRYEDDGLDIFAAGIGSPGHCASDASAMCKCEHCRYRPGLAWPPDVLTRLLEGDVARAQVDGHAERLSPVF
jgi:hypothetical protein